MLISIQIKNGSTLRADICGENCVCLCYDNSYMPGDVISFQCTEPGYYWVCLEDALAPVLAYFSGTPFEFLIPFGEKRSCYSQKCFIGNRHLLWVRIANPEEITAYRNLAFNPLDHHNNTSLFPHVYANVETRNEAWFSARNVINGNVASSGHGAYPYESWGINQRNDAALTVFFGRPVRINKLFITLRTDFPHDNWWKNATISFSDGTNLTLTFAKSGLPQAFEITPRVVDSLTMHDMYADESDPSPFPALTQLEVWGTEAET